MSAPVSIPELPALAGRGTACSQASYARLAPLVTTILGGGLSIALALWSMDYAGDVGSSPAFTRALAASVVAAGLIVSLLLAGLVHTHFRARARAAQVAQQLSDALAASQAAGLAKSQFLANMSHEIRTPLTAILGFSEILRSDAWSGSPADRIDAAQTIHRAAEHLLALINDILDHSKIEAGGMHIDPAEAPLAECLDQTRCLLAEKARSAGIALDFVLDPSLPDRLYVDPIRLRQILLNLLGNAIKFTPQGSVTLHAHLDFADPSPMVYFDVHDTGIGISSDHAERLFAPFVQADPSVNRRYGGTGLGLSISRHLARLMGGDVLLLRSEPHKGSCFRLTLPASTSPVLHQVASPSSAHDSSPAVELLRGARILLAEDGHDNQRLIAHHLRGAGAIVHVVSNGVAALRDLQAAEQERTPFDLLLTDVQMPEMDGYTLVRTLRAQHSPIPIIALTAHDLGEERSRCLAAGCNDFANKPIQRTLLLHICAQWAHPSAHRSLGSSAA